MSNPCSLSLAQATAERVSIPDRASDGFTLCGSAEANARIAKDLEALTRSVHDRLGSRLEAVLLLGSYARGEGGVVVRAGSAGPYNDYDLVAVVSRGAHGLRQQLSVLAHEWAQRVGVDVDIWPVDLGFIQSVPATLLWLDAAMGGLRVLSGDPALAEPVRKLRPRHVPLEECGRLLANRAVGIALSNLEGEGATEESMGRHGHKAVLACGDALLIAAGCYAPTLRERLAALEKLQEAPAIGARLVEAYREAIAFRTRPDLWHPPHHPSVRAWFEATRSQVQQWHLAFEAWRVGAPESPAAFAAWPKKLFPYLPDVRKGVAPLVAARAAMAGAASMFPYVGHPRERIARIAVALAYGLGDPDARRQAARLLGIKDVQPAPHADPAARARLVALSHKAG